jgi:hypothetical protein
LSSTQSGSSSSGRSASGTGSSVKFGVSNAEMRMTFQPEPGLQTFANSVFGSSGLPIARIRQSALVVIASTAVHNCSGTPHASSRMTSTYWRWWPWKPWMSVSAGLRPKPTCRPSSSFHSSDCRTRPGSGCPRGGLLRGAADLLPQDRVDLLVGGAVDTTSAVPGGWESIHHARFRDAMKLLPASWHDLTAVRRCLTTDSAIARCLDHRCSPSLSRTQPTGSVTYGDGGVGSNSRAAASHGEAGAMVTPLHLAQVTALR